MEAATRDSAVHVSWVAAPTLDVPDLQDAPKAPSVSSAADIKLWGRVNFAVTYDNFQGTGGIGGIDFSNFITQQGNEELSFNPRDSRFGFAASKTWGDWKGSAVFETDFYGTNAGANLIPRMRLGYVELAKKDGYSVRMGQDWVPIAIQNPDTLDFGILSWSGNLWNRVPQITARMKFNDDFDGTLGVMHSRVATAQDQQERMPWIVGRAAYNGLMDKKGTVALGGGFRKNTITPTGSPGKDDTSYVVSIEGKLPVVEGVTLTTELWTGQGIGGEFVRSGLDYDSTGDTMAGSGGFVSVSWKINDNLTCNFGGGVDQPKDKDTTATTAFGGAVPFDANRTIFANVKYEFTKGVGCGAEVMDMATELIDGATNINGQRLRGQRFTLGSWFTF